MGGLIFYNMGGPILYLQHGWSYILFTRVVLYFTWVVLYFIYNIGGPIFYNRGGHIIYNMGVPIFYNMGSPIKI